MVRKWVSRFAREESGVAMIEYALLVALIALVAIVGVSVTGTGINTQFMKFGCKLANPSQSCDQ